jgi:hypothetical protein
MIPRELDEPLLVQPLLSVAAPPLLPSVAGDSLCAKSKSSTVAVLVPRVAFPELADKMTENVRLSSSNDVSLIVMLMLLGGGITIRPGQSTIGIFIVTCNLRSSSRRCCVIYTYSSSTTSSSSYVKNSRSNIIVKLVFFGTECNCAGRSCRSIERRDFIATISSVCNYSQCTCKNPNICWRKYKRSPCMFLQMLATLQRKCQSW